MEIPLKNEQWTKGVDKTQVFKMHRIPKKSFNIYMMCQILICIINYLSRILCYEMFSTYHMLVKADISTFLGIASLQLFHMQHIASNTSQTKNKHIALDPRIYMHRIYNWQSTQLGQ